MDIKDYQEIIMYDPLSAQTYFTKKLSLDRLAAISLALKLRDQRLKHVNDSFLERLYAMKGLVV